MLENQLSQVRRDFANSFEQSMRQRVFSAEPIKVLSNSDDKKVELVRDVNDSHFVRRSYSKNAIDRIKGNSGLPFSQAWKEMQGIFSRTGIEVVPSVLFYSTPSENGSPVVVVSKYVEGEDIIHASTDLKVQLATSLGNMIGDSGNYYPKLEVFMQDMFRLEKGESGKLVLVDVDPYIFTKEGYGNSKLLRDLRNAQHIRSCAGLFWDEWCKTDEREEVLRAFFNSLAPVLRDADPNVGEFTENALLVVHAMSQGMDLRRAF